MATNILTKLSPDGLRYAAKPAGSPFQSGKSRSCFKCGVHRSPRELQSKRILGRTEMICAPTCHSVESAS